MSAPRRPIRTITVVTPCRQAERYVGASVQSVLGQTALATGRVGLQYLVCDGGSTDRTAEVVRRASAGQATLLSEPDRGMYDALAKGLRRAEGEVVTYLNAGDVLHPAAFDVVADLFETGRVRWLTGLSVHANERGQVIRTHLPYRYRPAHVRQGVFGLLLDDFIQQEGTFWDRALHATLDLDRLAGLRLAGDFYLWRSFATAAELDVVASHLATFLVHGGQLSEQMEAYRAEMRSLAEPCGPGDALLVRLDRWLARDASLHRKMRLNSRHLWRWDAPTQSWRTRWRP